MVIAKAYSGVNDELLHPGNLLHGPPNRAVATQEEDDDGIRDKAVKGPAVSSTNVAVDRCSRHQVVASLLTQRPHASTRSPRREVYRAFTAGARVMPARGIEGRDAQAKTG